jgi:hypothetical protein
MFLRLLTFLATFSSVTVLAQPVNDGAAPRGENKILLGAGATATKASSGNQSMMQDPSHPRGNVRAPSVTLRELDEVRYERVKKPVEHHAVTDRHPKNQLASAKGATEVVSKRVKRIGHTHRSDAKSTRGSTK